MLIYFVSSACEPLHWVCTWKLCGCLCNRIVPDEDLENGTSHNLVWGKPVTLFHTATDSRRHSHSRHSHYAEFLKPDAMGVMMRSRGRYFKGRFLRDGFQYLCRPNFRARKRPHRVAKLASNFDPIGSNWLFF